MVIGSLLGWGTWALVLFSINPFEAGLMGFVLFYASLAIGFVGALSLIGFVVRLWILKQEEIVLRQVTTAFRQACFFTILVVGSLFLQSRQLLAWWNILILIGLLSILELFALSLGARK